MDAVGTFSGDWWTLGVIHSVDSVGHLEWTHSVETGGHLVRTRSVETT